MSSAAQHIDAPRVERIHSFDLLRGLFLIIILCNHLFYYPSGLELLTGKGFLYVSAAEGFFLISGVILGIVRGQKLIRKPFSVGAKLLLKRAFQLYVTSVVLAVLFTLLGWAFFLDNPGLKAGIIDPSTPILSMLWQLSTYQSIYGWADFLRQYAIFIALAPIALYLLRRGWWYVLLIISAGIWSLYPLTPGGALWQPVAWQALFYGGFTVGFYWPQIHGRWRRFSAKNRRIIGRGLVASFVVTLFASALLVYGFIFPGTLGDSLTSLHNVVEQYFNKDRQPLPRLLLAGLWLAGLFWLFRRYEAAIIQRVGWLLTPLGTNSLYVYTIQAFIVFFMHLYVLKTGGSDNWLINLSLSLAALAVVWLAVRKRFLFGIIPR